MITAEVIADSLHPGGSRLTTLQLTYPRFIHAEVMTHRNFARNSASSRAIPMRAFRAQVLSNPAEPAEWGAAGKGMSASGPLPRWKAAVARRLWLGARYPACAVHWAMERLGVAKQITNRGLEPYQHMVVVATATDQAWESFLALRDHPAADPTIQALARAVRGALTVSEPVPRHIGDWHLPYCTVDRTQPGWLKAAHVQSVARCARVSYGRVGTESSAAADTALYLRLTTAVPPHASPLEHQAVALPITCGGQGCFGPDSGWQQLRHQK